MKHARFLPVLVVLFCSSLVPFLSTPSASADEIYTFVVKKEEEKRKSRWSLADWIDTRDRMRMMDLWLALHTPTPYEFYIFGDYQMGDYKTGGNYKGWRFGGAAYATIFGLEFQKETIPNRVSGMLHFRIFGYNSQNTNITLQFGMTSRSEDVTFRNALAGGSMTVYITKVFGLDGFIRHYFTSVGFPGGKLVSGTRYEGGGFIDFRFLRLFGTYFSEPESRTDPVTLAETATGSSGWLFGTKFYF